MNDKYLHCFERVAGWAHSTLCGRTYHPGSVYAEWPQRFIEIKDELPIGVALCPDCLNHEDLPLQLLGDV